MLTDIDIIIPLGILLAMFLSNEPKKSVIAFIILVNLSSTGIDYFNDGWNGWLPILLVAALEAYCAILIVLMAKELPEFKDRLFFWLMAVLLWISSGIGIAFVKIGLSFYGGYVFMSELTAVIHLIIMLSMSDGIRNFAGNIRNSLIANRGGFTNS